MSVKVVDATPDPAIVKKVSCRNCGARLEYTPNDVKTYSGTDYSGGPDGMDWVDCPNCNKRAVIRSW